MKAFISVDLEGLPFIVIPGQLNLKGSLYDEARDIATKITLAAVYELKENGFDQIYIADSHGPMVNIKVNDLPEYVEIIRGNPRPISMVLGVEECDVAIFLGYHAKFGTAKSTFDHTYSGATIRQVEVNDIPASEFLLNAYVAGEYNVPVILVGGESQLLKDDVEKFGPWIETLPFKQSYSRIASKSPSMKKIVAELQKSIKQATNNFKDKKTKPLKATHEVKMKITFLSTLFADIAELLPFITRIDGLTVEYKAKDMIEGYKIFQLLVTAAGGINAYMNNIQ
ncbi:MAG: M55 family metallopeptidase [Candidatus Heimdallarchaeota archaeon]|nr:M55 family metallopeptidase [Candidatus Heimdallarchaeota archaeon]